MRSFSPRSARWLRVLLIGGVATALALVGGIALGAPRSGAQGAVVTTSSTTTGTSSTTTGTKTTTTGTKTTTTTTTTSTTSTSTTSTRRSPTGVSLRASAHSVRRHRTRITFNGQVLLPGSLKKSKVCFGNVRITIKHGRRTLLTENVRLSRRCKFGGSTTVRNRQLHNGGGRVFARFEGNRRLFPRSGGPAFF